MSPKRGERVAPPPAVDGYDLIYGSNEAIKGWQDLCSQAASATRTAYFAITSNPQPAPPTDKHHPLKFDLATGKYNGDVFPQWQYEVTGGARIWYLVDTARRRVIVTYASTRHPKATDR
ncbi:hypothetical protein ABZS66_36180 [Dactylosporangium sp. NPDC005572]|uniref:hypothetical protein n=1 Tax=Dactylosporangium sp. NPDC005572 TaxID=3156889 RepID=UPI0033BCB993